MNVLMRHFGWVVLTAAVVLGLASAPVQAQRLPMVPAPNPGLGQPAAIAGLGNAAVLGRGLVQSPFSGAGPLSFGMNFGPISTAGGLGRMANPVGFGGLNRITNPLAFGSLNRIGSPLGFGSLAASPLGFGSLAASQLGYASLAGAGLGYGGYGTQWMQNPYEGYLSGAASVTKANAQYQLTIQQARIVREQATQEHYRTRRAMMEQAEYEWAHRPDPEKIRQAALNREMDIARNSPPLTDVWSGHSLNVLLRNAIARQGEGVRGPNVPLNEDNLKSINLTAGDTRGNVGLLKDNGNLQWPQSLNKGSFKDAREDLSRHLKQAFRTVQLNRNPDESTLSDLQADLKKLQQTLDANVLALSLDEYTEAQRYVRLLGDTITALRDPNVSNYVNGAWTPRGKNVAELVQFMRDKGLWFAPAARSDEAAYTSLYYALAAFDAGMPRTAHTSEGSRSGGNGDSGASNPR